MNMDDYFNSPITYLDNEHELFVKDCMAKACGQRYDCERMALFYTLGLMETLRNNINALYDFKMNWIKREGLMNGFQTGGTRALTLLAFSLYNNFSQNIPLLLREEEIYKAEKVKDDDFGYDYDYTEEKYTGYLTGEPYIMARQSPSLLEMFRPVDKHYIPYMFEAIRIRLEMISYK